MARAATTTDVFNAIAEPRRRQILDLLAAGGPCAVGVLVLALGLPQPTVSKHLGVLREVGLVSVEKQGQSRVYQLNASEIQAVHTWTQTFECSPAWASPDPTNRNGPASSKGGAASATSIACHSHISS
jgi:DNA-binding transcriptional ArsR family regulator